MKDKEVKHGRFVVRFASSGDISVRLADAHPAEIFLLVDEYRAREAGQVEPEIRVFGTEDDEPGLGITIHPEGVMYDLHEGHAVDFNDVATEVNLVAPADIPRKLLQLDMNDLKDELVAKFLRKRLTKG
jgi:hypothetical protein